MEFGLPLGDIYLLFEKFVSKADRKRQLKTLIQNVRSGSSKSKAKKKKETVDVNFKWHNFNKKTNKFVMMRAESAGGNQTVHLNRS